jgi:putative oxidoreductase
VNAIVVSVTECFGGLLLLLGLGTRFIAPIFVFEMVVAYATSEQEALHAIFSDPDKFVSAAPFLFLFASALVFVFGPGRFSLDALVFKGGPRRSP